MGQARSRRWRRDAQASERSLGHDQPERAGNWSRRSPKVYPGAHCELDFKTPLQLLVATILSAQCTDKRVNMVTPALFSDIAPRLITPRRRRPSWRNDSNRPGFFRSKAKSIERRVPRSRESMAAKCRGQWRNCTGFRGSAAKRPMSSSATPSAINEGIVVDTHVARLSQRLGLTKRKDPEKIEHDLMKLVPREQWTIGATGSSGTGAVAVLPAVRIAATARCLTLPFGQKVHPHGRSALRGLGDCRKVR